MSAVANESRGQSPLDQTTLDPDLPRRLRLLRERLAPLLAVPASPTLLASPRSLREREPASTTTGALVRRIVDLLDRDLLPRTAGADAYLVIGIVGPNNAGKSTLFNSLVGRTLSPAIPTGGATRRLIGAARPELVERLAAEPTLSRFPLRRHTGETPVRVVLEDGEDPAELCIVSVAELPAGVLVIDTPDFDSVLERNRLASESLLQVADLAVVVVTRHTYQNKEVVSFLEGWLAHGRPWLLVYNESLGDDITREHAAKLASDLETPPVAVFHAPFDLEIQRSDRALQPVALSVHEKPVEGETQLAAWLFDPQRSSELKERALGASLARLEEDTKSLIAGLREHAAEAADVLAAAREEALHLGTAVAGHAMPMGPFLEAFRTVLDRRPNVVQRRFRAFIRKTRLLAEGLLSRFSVTPRRSKTADPASELVGIERRELEPRWAPFFEELSLALRPGGAFWQARDQAQEGPRPDQELLQALGSDLAPEAGDPALARALETVGRDPEVLRTFGTACEELIEEQLDRRGGDWVLQFAVDGMHLLPAVAAGIVIFKTGGLGIDVAVAGAGALSTLMAERLSKLLGTEVARRARERWSRLRGERLAEVLVHATLIESHPLLALRADATAQSADELASLLEKTP